MSKAWQLRPIRRNFLIPISAIFDPAAAVSHIKKINRSHDSLHAQYGRRTRCRIGSASLARSIRIRFHFRHRTGRIRSVSDHRAGRVWRSRHRSKTPNCLPGARDQVPALFRNAIERRGASVDSNSGAPITQSTFNMLRRMANLLSLLNWWLHRYDNEDDYALFQV